MTQIVPKLRFSLLIALLTICAAGSLHTHAQTLVCRAPKILGYEAPHARAEQRLSKPTSSTSNMEVFVTTKGDELYLHTNYRPRGWKYSWKLTTTEGERSLSFWISYLTNPEIYKSSNTLARGIHEEIVKMRYGSGMKIFVEEKVLNHPRYRDLDFGEATDLVLIGSDGIARSTKIFERSDGSLQRIVELRENHIYADIKKPDAISMMRRFNSKLFKRNDVKVLSLVQDLATVSKVDELIPSRNRIAFDFSSVDALNRELSRHRGSTVFVIGHIPEGSGRLVVENTAGQDIFTIPIQQLEAMARTNDSSVIILGCKAAKATTTGGGPLNDLNSIVAVERLAAAMNARNYGEFAETLAGPNLVLVADDALMHGANRRIITLTFRQALERGIGPALVAGSLIVAETIDDDGSRRNRRPHKNN